MARWLVARTSWGTLSTLDHLTQAPNGEIVGHSDYVAGLHTGRLYVYLSLLEVSFQALQFDNRTSFTITEAQLTPDGPTSCHGVDTQDPPCARVSLLGRMLPVPDGPGKDMAYAAFIAKHPAAAKWPLGHQFALHELHIKEAQLFDWYGGMHFIPAAMYYNATLAITRAL